MKDTITKEDTFDEAIKKNPASMKVFVESGMLCLEDSYLSFESIEQGAAVHGINVEVLIDQVNSQANRAGKMRKS